MWASRPLATFDAAINPANGREAHFTAIVAGPCEYGVVDFLCEDLPRHGVVLVPPTAEDYDLLLEDIQHRANAPDEGSPPFPERFRPRIIPEERPTSAILLNQNAKSIAGLQVIWRFVTDAGRSFRHSRGMLSANNLLPFNQQSESTTKWYTYWQTIFPSSKRYLGESGMMGDNTDVRPPAEDEKWRGGIITGGGSGGGKSREPIRQVTLVLDGVFFLDGELSDLTAKRCSSRQSPMPRHTALSQGLQSPGMRTEFHRRRFSLTLKE
jgi:hypothetical protein